MTGPDKYRFLMLATLVLGLVVSALVLHRANSACDAKHGVLVRAAWHFVCLDAKAVR